MKGVISMKAPRITREELKRKLDAGAEVVLLDVRNLADYAASQVKIINAVRIPLDELEKRAGELDPDKEVAAYCT